MNQVEMARVLDDGPLREACGDDLVRQAKRLSVWLHVLGGMLMLAGFSMLTLPSGVAAVALALMVVFILAGGAVSSFGAWLVEYSKVKASTELPSRSTPAPDGHTG